MKALILLAALAAASPALGRDARQPQGRRGRRRRRRHPGATSSMAPAPAGATPVRHPHRKTASMLSARRRPRRGGPRAGLDWANAEGTAPDRGPQRARPSPANIAARGNVDVPGLGPGPISTGEIVQPQDLVWGKAAPRAGPTPPMIRTPWSACPPAAARCAPALRSAAADVIRPLGHQGPTRS